MTTKGFRKIVRCLETLVLIFISGAQERAGLRPRVASAQWNSGSQGLFSKALQFDLESLLVLKHECLQRLQMNKPTRKTEYIVTLKSFDFLIRYCKIVTFLEREQTYLDPLCGWVEFKQSFKRSYEILRSLEMAKLLSVSPRK